MRNLRLLDCTQILGLILLLTLTAGKSAWGSVVSGCTPDTCTWEISVDDTVVMSGMYIADPETGNISLANPVVVDGGDFTVSLDSMSGNIDPVLGFGLGATNTSGTIKSFAFAFSLPLGGLAAPLNTYAELGTTLTPITGGTASVFPTLGGGKIMDSQDIVINPFQSVDKGVDVGNGLTATGTTAVNIETATGLIATGGPFDLMSVVVAFGLTDQTGVGMSGKVEQTVVPIPATVWLFGSGLLGMIGVSRRRKKAA